MNNNDFESEDTFKEGFAIWLDEGGDTVENYRLTWDYEDRKCEAEDELRRERS